MGVEETSDTIHLVLQGVQYSGRNNQEIILLGGLDRSFRVAFRV